MAKNKKRKPSSSPDAVLASLVREIEWLKEARHDDSVSEAEWHMKGKAVMMRGARLPAQHATAFQQHYMSMQQLEMVEQLEANLGEDAPAGDVPGAVASDDAPVDAAPVSDDPAPASDVVETDAAR